MAHDRRQTDGPAIAYSSREFTFATNRYIWLPFLRLNTARDGFPWDDLRKIFRECQRTAKVPNGVEILQKFQPAE